jgi:hypothetical protein
MLSTISGKHPHCSTEVCHETELSQLFGVALTTGAPTRNRVALVTHLSRHARTEALMCIGSQSVISPVHHGAGLEETA